MTKPTEKPVKPEKLERQPDTTTNKDHCLLQTGKKNAEKVTTNITQEDITKFGLKDSQQVFEFFRTQGGVQLMGIIKKNEAIKEYIQEISAMEETERKNLLISVLAAAYYRNAEAAEERKELQDNQEMVNREKLDDRYEHIDQPQADLTPEEELKDDRDYAFAEEESGYVQFELANLDDIEKALAEFEAKLNEFAELLKVEMEKAKENTLKANPKASDDEIEKARNKAYQELITQKFSTELTQLDQEVEQTSEAKTTTPGNAPKGMPKPQNERQREDFARMRQNFAQQMVQRVNQVAQVGHEPTKDRANQANLDTNRAEHTRSGIIATNTQARKSYETAVPVTKNPTDLLKDTLSKRRDELSSRKDQLDEQIRNYQIKTAARQQREMAQHLRGQAPQPQAKDKAPEKKANTPTPLPTTPLPTTPNLKNK
ncbi:MAG: hypothetical protein A3F18_05075 [Legionellales bacterium RIFCSPHIGHO2_12_FULL_37_14]|nr:MAG: hypothetical protein A3F18_05075 [Legionellales bacterium RIFCSPHIGHO2_12_FULL_37_14]